MKFPHLGLGERFLFEGRPYRKTGPIAATDETTGQTRMIPRYARLEPLTGVPSQAVQAPPATLHAAFAAYDTACTALLDAHAIPVAERAGLLAARDALLALLNKRPS